MGSDQHESPVLYGGSTGLLEKESVVQISPKEIKCGLIYLHKGRNRVWDQTHYYGEKTRNFSRQRLLPGLHIDPGIWGMCPQNVDENINLGINVPILDLGIIEFFR